MPNNRIFHLIRFDHVANSSARHQTPYSRSSSARDSEQVFLHQRLDRRDAFGPFGGLQVAPTGIEVLHEFREGYLAQLR